ncbi:MAG TPA: DUF6503 family protein [Thermoanaerobaculia bacterium]|nr:DUF6503 family protein [Thermoanaerobaculia bacterium]
MTRLRARRTLPPLVLGLACLALPASAGAQDWVERLPIVDRSIEHHGGAAYTASETSLDLCSASGCFAIQVRTDGGLFEHVVTREDGMRVRATNDSVERWEGGRQVPVPPEEEARRRRFVSARVYFVFLPYRLNDPGVWKQDLGIVDWEGRPLHRVRVQFAARAPGGDLGSETGQTSDEYMYWFDPETGEVVYFAYDFVGEPSGLRFRRAINRRRVGGILFFDQENLGRDGDGLDVGQVDPRFVAERLKPISVVELRNIEVRPLSDG